jgi:hypothetical protein
MERLCVLVLFPTLLLAAGCIPQPRTQPDSVPAPPPPRPTRIDYVDSDAFDILLESTLVNQDPVIVIQTQFTRPEWGNRLNAWIAAWNRGGAPKSGATYRTQAPGIPNVKVDGDTIREFRLLIESLMDRIDEKVREGSQWYAEEKVRNRRVALLKPYNLRFHIDEDGLIQVIMFHARYASSYPDFVRALGETQDDREWRRGFTCSYCKQRSRAETDTSSITGTP